MRASLNWARPASPSRKPVAMQKGVLNFAAYGVGGRCFTASGSHRRCTVPSATSQTISAMSAARTWPLGELDRAVDEGLRHGAAGVRLERNRLHHPASAEVVEKRLEIGRDRRRECPVHAVDALEHRARPQESAARHQRGAHARLRGPARMHALGPCALGKVFDDSGGHAAGDAKRRDDRRGRQPQCRARRAGRREGAEYRRRMEPCLVRRRRRHQAEPAQQLRAGDDAGEQPVAAEPFPLADGEHRRHDDGARMHRPPLERVVVVLAVGGSAVDQRGAEHVKSLRPLPAAGCPIAVHGPPASIAPSVAATYRSRRAAMHKPATSRNSCRAAATASAGRRSGSTEASHAAICSATAGSDRGVFGVMRRRLGAPRVVRTARSRMTHNGADHENRGEAEKHPRDRIADERHVVAARQRQRAPIVRLHHEPQHHTEHHREERDFQ